MFIHHWKRHFKFDFILCSPVDTFQQCMCQLTKTLGYTGKITFMSFLVTSVCFSENIENYGTQKMSHLILSLVTFIYFIHYNFFDNSTVHISFVQSIYHFKTMMIPFSIQILILMIILFISLLPYFCSIFILLCCICETKRQVTFFVCFHTLLIKQILKQCYP